MRISKWLFAAGLVIGAQTLGAATLAFSTTFEGGLPPEISGAGSVVSTEGYPGFEPGVLTKFYQNASTGNPAASTVLTLTGLPVHTYLDVMFLLAVIDSWDGTAPIDGPDAFNVKVDGSTVFSGTYTNFAGGEAYNGTRLFFNQAAGFNPAYGDSAYSLAITNIAHTASTATIEFFADGAGWTGGEDESWAIDNLDVYTGAPEPGSLLLLVSGAGALLLRRFRK